MLRFQFFRPSQRTVSCHNGLLDTRTKHITAEDRFVVAERRQVDAEHRRSTGYLQTLSHEQKLLERRHSTQIVPSLPRANSWNEGIAHLNQNHLLLPKIKDFNRRYSASSDGESVDDEHQQANIVRPPSVAVIPPDSDVSFFVT